jgi:hypothetical protein
VNIHLKPDNMKNLFHMGGPIFMGILTIILIAVIATAVFCLLQQRKESSDRISAGLVKEIGLFGLIVGIFGQFLGLYSAFSMIEKAGTISQELLISGLKISSITTIYGLIICLTAWLLYFGLKLSGQKIES